MMSDTIQSLCRQLGELEENLRLIQEQKSKYVLDTDVPMQLVKNERRLETQIADLRAQIARCQAAHLFIAYKRDADPDHKLARYLHDFLTAHGHDVFIDATTRAGVNWLDEIDRQIKASDFLIVLLSEASADSEMVQAEVRRAYEYRRQQGHPRTLPVRIAYEDPLPYSIDFFLNPLQYVVWRSDADNERVGNDILAAIERRLPEREPVQLRAVAGKLVLSEDGRAVADGEGLHPPLPEFDPRFLEELEAIGGYSPPRPPPTPPPFAKSAHKNLPRTQM